MMQEQTNSETLNESPKHNLKYDDNDREETA